MRRAADGTLNAPPPLFSTTRSTSRLAGRPSCRKCCCEDLQHLRRSSREKVQAALQLPTTRLSRRERQSKYQEVREDPARLPDEALSEHGVAHQRRAESEVPLVRGQTAAGDPRAVLRVGA